MQIYDMNARFDKKLDKILENLGQINDLFNLLEWMASGQNYEQEITRLQQLLQQVTANPKIAKQYGWTVEGIKTKLKELYNRREYEQTKNLGAVAPYTSGIEVEAEPEAVRENLLKWTANTATDMITGRSVFSLIKKAFGGDKKARQELMSDDKLMNKLREKLKDPEWKRKFLT